MDQKAIHFYRSIFADLTIDRQEAAELSNFLKHLNAPPDKLTWLRANAFKIGSEFLCYDNKKETNLALLRAINYVIHAIEAIYYDPKPSKNFTPFNEETLSNFYKSILNDGNVDAEENAAIERFFRDTYHPAPSDMIQTRALCFKVASSYLSEDNRDQNVQLLRVVNTIIHVFEHTCLQPKPFVLHMEKETLSGLTEMDLSGAIQYLWKVDDNRVSPGQDYLINVQSGKKPYWKEDKAPDPLFTKVDPAVWKRPTYAAFVALLDNYSSETGVAEIVTNQERYEIQRFLQVVMETPSMQFCHKYCHTRDPHGIPSEPADFKQLLQKIWFDLYRRERGGRMDSSGFEHVFVGEVKDGKISGFHNWIQFYWQERNGKLDYRGYLKPKGHKHCPNKHGAGGDGSGSHSEEATTDNDDRLLTIQFNWGGIEKFASSMFVGVSPEFEMALYTICFLVGHQDNDIELDTGNESFSICVKCFKMAKDKIGTSFPEVTAHHEDH